MSRIDARGGAASRNSGGEGRTREQLLATIPLKDEVRTVHGVSTAVLEGGEGPPLLLLHGAGEFAAVWLRVIPELARTHHVVVPDLPGQGASETAGGKPLDADGVLAWLGELIDRTCDSPPVLVGHLLGGAIAARYAAGHGHRIAHLVLVDTMGLTWYRPSPRFALPMTGFLARPTAKSRDRFFDQCFLDRDELRRRTGGSWEPLMDYALDRARTGSVQAAVRRQMTQLGVRPVRPEALAGIDVPTTLIHGRHDLQVPLKTAEEAAARYGWALHVIDGCRDDPAVEQPEAFVEALRTALERP